MKRLSAKIAIGVTLIELIVVVAVLTLLAVIGLYSMQSASTRARVSRIHNDMRQLGAGVEIYKVDWNVYPPAAIGDWQLERPLTVLTTPVAYLAGLPEDPFGPAVYDFNAYLVQEGYEYKDRRTTSRGMPGETFGGIWEALAAKEYFIHASGPDRQWNVWPYIEYDPTNGVLSAGDITRFGPF